MQLNRKKIATQKWNQEAKRYNELLKILGKKMRTSLPCEQSAKKTSYVVVKF